MSTKIISFQEEYEKRLRKKPKSCNLIAETELITGSRRDYLRECKLLCESKRNFVLMDILESLYSG